MSGWRTLTSLGDKRSCGRAMTTAAPLMDGRGCNYAEKYSLEDVQYCSIGRVFLSLGQTNYFSGTISDSNPTRMPF